MFKVTLDAEWLNRLPKLMFYGENEIALTANTHLILNLTGSTWLAPVILIGMLIVNSSYGSLAGSSSCFTRYFLQFDKIDLSGLNLSQISNEPLP